MRKIKANDLLSVYTELVSLSADVDNIFYDDLRGHWGTDVELALEALHSDITDALEQLRFVREKRGELK